METIIEKSDSTVLDLERGRLVIAKLFRALGDTNRLALLSFISGGERTASECIEFIGLTQSRASAHLACLVNCGLISVRRESRFAYYQIIDSRVEELLELGIAITADHVASIAACLNVS